MNQVTEKNPVQEERKRKAFEEQTLEVASGAGDHSESNSKNMETIISHLGFLYQKASMRIKMAIFGNEYGMGSEAFLQDCRFVSALDNVMLACNSESRRIIRRQFFEDSDEDWYEDFYSKEAFQKRLISAMCEFLRRCKDR